MTYREPIPPELLNAAGEALFGQDWIVALARALDVDRKTVSRWAAGQTRVTPAIAPELVARLQRKAVQVEATLAALAPFVAGENPP